MFKLNDLSMEVDDFCIKDINLTVDDSECHVIIGPTGSGKTLVLESVIGFREPREGEMVLNNHNITELPIEEKGISYVPQDLGIFPHLTVKENILYGLKARGIKNKQEYTLAFELAAEVGIDHLLERQANNLSGGEKQRVALVRALANKNNFLLLDEPFSALHEGLKKELWILLKELQEEYKFKILMVTHDLEEAFFLGDKLSVMINGRIHQTGTKREVYYNPATAEVANFFGIKNLFAGEITEINNSYIMIDCKKLDQELKVLYKDEKGFNKRERLIVGIRAEEVMILKSTTDNQTKDNLIEGRVLKIFAKGAYNTVLFKPSCCDEVIEIQVPNHAFERLRIAKDKKTRISLQSEKIFIMAK